MSKNSVKLNIQGMSCSNCAKTIEKKFENNSDVYEVKVSFASSSGNFSYNNSKISTNEIVKEISSLGYKASFDVKQMEEEGKKRFKILKMDFFIALIFSCFLLYFIFFPMEKNDYMLLSIASVVQLYAGRRFYILSYKAIKNGNLDMNVLVTLGTWAAYAYSAFVIVFPNVLPKELNFHYLEGSCMIITFILFGRFLEEKSKTKATKYLKKFEELIPEESIVENSKGEVTVVKTKDIKVGDILIVKDGDKIPTDAIVVEGTAEVDTSFVTGEFMLVPKKVEDQVIGGTINKSGYIKVRVIKKSSDSLISKIINILNNSQNKKLPISRLANKVASIFVPTVIFLSILTFSIWAFVFDNVLYAITTSICVLIISCPCALGLATPIAIVNAIGRGSKEGLLVKNPEIVEIIKDIKYAVFDKTGTLTKGEISIESYLLKNNDEQQLLNILSSIQNQNTHPISKAFMKLAQEKKVKSNIKVTNIKTLVGKGIFASILLDNDDKQSVLIGSKELLKEYKIKIDSKFMNFYEEKLNLGYSVVFSSINKKCVGVFSLSDTIKTEAAQTISQLKKQHITPILLTGDKDKIAHNISQKLGIKRFYSQVLSQEKYEIIKKLQKDNKKVLFIGDGINDVLALKQADISIALSNGVDLTKEVGDILLINSHLHNIIKSINLSKKSIQVIKQNLFWAFFYNILGIPLAAGVFYPFLNVLLSPMYSGIAMSFSSVIVVLNSLRIRNMKLN